MIDFTAINRVIEKLWLPKRMDFILRKRLCFKHMRQFVKKHKLKDKRIVTYQLLGICSKCHKGGIVYYLESKYLPKALKNVK